MRRSGLVMACLVVVSLILVGIGCAQSTPPVPAGASPPAQAVTKPYFEGKTIGIIVAASPGGGTDILARVLAKHMPRFLPGKPSMIVRNMPGGEAIIGSNYVYASKPDGMTVLLSSTKVLMNNLLPLPSVHYDLLKMPAVIGSGSSGVIYTRTGVIDKPEDIMKKGLVFAFGAGSSDIYVFLALKEAIGFPMEKMVTAYPSASDVRRGFLAGEVAVGYDSVSAYNSAIVPLVAKGEIIPIYQLGAIDDKGDIVKDPGLPTDILTGKELYERIHGKPPSGMAWEAYKVMISAAVSYGKNLFLPPGTPDSIVKTYWSAAEKLIEDPAFLKETELLQGKGAWTAGEALDKAFRQNYKMDPQVRDWFLDILRKYKVRE